MASTQKAAVTPSFPRSYLVVGAMSIIAAWLVSMIVGLLLPSWRAGAYLVGAALAVGVAVLQREAIAREKPSREALAAARVRELLTVAIAVFPAALILRYLPWDPAGLADMALNIWFEPQTYIDWRDGVTVVLLLAAWAFPIRPLDFLERLVVTQKDLPPPRPLDAYDDLTSVRFNLPDLTATLRKLTTWALATTFVLGVALAVVWQGFGTFAHAVTGGALILYAVLGFALLTLANYQLRQSRWLIEGVTPEDQSADRWAITGTALTAGLAVLALLVPAVLLLFVTRVVIAGVLYGVFALLHLLGNAVQAPAVTPGQMILPPMPFIKPPLPPQPQQHAAAAPGWLTPVAIAAAVLIVAFAIIALATWLHRSGRGPKRQWLRSLGGLIAFLASLGVALRRWLAGLRGVAAEFAARAQRAPAAAFSRLRARGGPPGGDSAALVRYWYGQVVRQGARVGVPRRPGQTAAEYRAMLHRQAADAVEDLDALTAAYIEARYSAHAVPEVQGTSAQRQYRHIREALAAWLRRNRRGERA